MPLHGHHHSSSGHNQPGTAAGIFQAAHALGSIGAPTGNLRAAISGTTGAGTDILLPGGSSSSVHHGGGQTAPPSSTGLPVPGAPAIANNLQEPQTPRRTMRMSDELHMSGGPHAMGQYVSPHAAQQQQQSSYNTEYAAGATPGISLQQATPQGSHSAAPSSTSDVPGSLQPGGAGRPAPSSAYTAPTTVPTMPHINTNAQQYTLPTRSNTMTASHSHSRSSPAGMEQKYIPFSNTPENSKYAQTPTQKYYGPTTPSSAIAQSPLNLEHIRPRANSGMGDDSMGGMTFADAESIATNCNFVAPWPTYAFDWCNWPVHGGTGAGKMAVGSYLESPHNFVSGP